MSQEKNPNSLPLAERIAGSGDAPAVDIARAWWPRAAPVEPLTALHAMLDHLEKCEPASPGVADIFARALRLYLAGYTDITRNLGLRPRRGGRHETPLAHRSSQARNDCIRRVFELQEGRSNRDKAEKVAALLRSEPKQGAVTEEQMLGYVLQLHAEFGGTLPTSARQVLRVISGV